MAARVVLFDDVLQHPGTMLSSFFSTGNVDGDETNSHAAATSWRFFHDRERADACPSVAATRTSFSSKLTHLEGPPGKITSRGSHPGRNCSFFHDSHSNLHLQSQEDFLETENQESHNMNSSRPVWKNSRNRINKYSAATNTSTPTSFLFGAIKSGAAAIAGKIPNPMDYTIGKKRKRDLMCDCQEAIKQHDEEAKMHENPRDEPLPRTEAQVAANARKDLEEQLETEVIFTTHAKRYADALQQQLQEILTTAQQVHSDAQRSLEQSAAALANAQEYRRVNGVGVEKE
ncbi:unnamed protein product [Amoebophrya sp. A120]|nr:unnamed protein product [Amoebophrya sp. A120]|eukprot:GSA120T00020908001.1